MYRWQTELASQTSHDFQLPGLLLWKMVSNLPSPNPRYNPRSQDSLRSISHRHCIAMEHLYFLKNFGKLIFCERSKLETKSSSDISGTVCMKHWFIIQRSESQTLRLKVEKEDWGSPQSAWRNQELPTFLPNFRCVWSGSEYLYLSLINPKKHIKRFLKTILGLHVKEWRQLQRSSLDQIFVGVSFEHCKPLEAVHIYLCFKMHFKSKLNECWWKIHLFTNTV